MDIIDGHVHVWPNDRTQYPPARMENYPFRADIDADADTLLALMDAHGVARTIIVQSPWYADDDRYLEYVVARYPTRFTAIGCAPFGLNEIVAKRVTARLGRGSIRSARIQFLTQADIDFALDGGLDAFFERAEQIGYPILIFHRSERMLPYTATIAMRHPTLSLVIEHMAFATEKFGNGQTYRAALIALAPYPNIYVKLALHHQLSAERFPWRDLQGFQQTLIDAFGAKRLFWGSNFPMFMPDPSYDRRLSVLRDYFPFHSQADRDWILGGTAARLWPLSQQ